MWLFTNYKIIFRKNEAERKLMLNNKAKATSRTILQRRWQINNQQHTMPNMQTAAPYTPSTIYLNDCWAKTQIIQKSFRRWQWQSSSWFLILDYAKISCLVPCERSALALSAGLPSITYSKALKWWRLTAVNINAFTEPCKHISALPTKFKFF